jgi:hypothetical protein
MGDELHVEPDIDVTIYTTLAGHFRTMAQEVKAAGPGRRKDAAAALASWNGQAKTRFMPRMDVGDTDCEGLTKNLTAAANALDDGGGFNGPSMKSAALRENERRRLARLELVDLERRRKEYRKKDSVWSSVKDAVGYDDWKGKVEVNMPPEVPEPVFDADPGSLIRDV